MGVFFPCPKGLRGGYVGPGWAGWLVDSFRCLGRGVFQPLLVVAGDLLLKLQYGPVKDVVVLIPGPNKGLPQQVAQVVVVRLVVEPQAPAVVKVRHKLLRKLLAKHFDRRGHLSLADLLVLLFFRGRLEPLPGEAAAQKVQEHVPQRLQVVPPALLYTQVGVDRGVPRSPCQVLVLSVRNVLVCPGIPILFGQPKVDDVHLVRLLPQAHQEVVRLDIPVDEAPGVHVLDPSKQLVRQHEHRLERKPPVAKVEEVFERGTQQVHDHDVVVPLDAVPPHHGDPDAPLEDLVQLRLVEELRVLRPDRLQLDGDLISRLNVRSQVDVPERPTADPPAEAVLVADSQFLLAHAAAAVPKAARGALVLAGASPRSSVAVAVASASAVLSSVLLRGPAVPKKLAAPLRRLLFAPPHPKPALGSSLAAALLLRSR
mmetsp:Transcript_22320/g.46874  ORF Transcript_22320/g.46874 Transcript_22320/m.46874 type:complete len:427 (-) Transcript_22320:824-2104(-)